MKSKPSPPRDPKLLGQLLRDYLLSSRDSLMSEAVRSIVEAYIGGRAVSVEGVRGETISRVERILKRLEIDYTLELRTKQKRPAEGDRYRIRVYVPSGLERLWDYALLVPFCIEKAVNEVKGRGFDIEMPKVQMQFLVYLRTGMFDVPIEGECSDHFEENIKSRVIKSMQTGAITPESDMRENQFTTQIIHGQLTDMCPKALLYIGCVPDTSRCVDVADAQDAVSVLINNESNRQEQESHTSYPVNPKVKKNLELSLSQLEIIQKNLQRMEKLEYSIHVIEDEWECSRESITRRVAGNPESAYMSEDVKQCLEQRIAGLSEKAICRSLGMTPAEYISWQQNHHINIAPSNEDSTYARWLAAAKALGVDQLEDAPALTNQLGIGVEPSHERSVSDEADDVEEFEHTDDYRSVKIRGELIELTPKQAEVVTLLDRARLGGFPAVAQDMIISEVYGENYKERRLKKAFQNDVGYEKLIAKGQRRDTVRLKI